LGDLKPQFGTYLELKITFSPTTIKKDEKMYEIFPKILVKDRYWKMPSI